MIANAPRKPSRKRLALGAAGFFIGGLAPLVTGLVDMWQFLNHGYFISKTGALQKAHLRWWHRESSSWPDQE